MFNIHIITLGALSKPYWIDAEAEYKKRLGAYAKIKITELKEELQEFFLSREGLVDAIIPPHPLRHREYRLHVITVSTFRIHRNPDLNNCHVKHKRRKHARAQGIALITSVRKSTTN